MKIDWKTIDTKELAAIVISTLKEKDIDAVLVGGACINIYSYNKFMSYDLDFVSHGKEKDISKVLTGLGFKKKESRHFIRDDCPFFVEFVSPPLAIGNEPVKTCEKIDTPQGTIILLTPTDCVKDRLASYYHWNDPQALNQAIAVVKDQEVDLKEVKRWSIKEGHGEKFKEFIAYIKMHG
ncbi:MAG: hypothetical protein ABSB95_05960 [Dissulfurispiraceae bacterium]|jgi:hypothetical protein